MTDLVERVGRVVARETYQRMPGHIATCEGIGLAVAKEVFDWLAEPSEAVEKVGYEGFMDGLAEGATTASNVSATFQEMLRAARKEALGPPGDEFITIPRIS